MGERGWPEREDGRERERDRRRQKVRREGGWEENGEGWRDGGRDARSPQHHLVARKDPLSFADA